ncbi:hypothetical protein Hgul01_01678 [Herpetosiphon gulosus]|uniref:Uncharacterized protein n=1 Tax=Herpetosiphon gulosus TaxID=1973496 RepID=A0ABP9WXF5_9CHLR
MRDEDPGVRGWESGVSESSKSVQSVAKHNLRDLRDLRGYNTLCPSRIKTDL